MNRSKFLQLVIALPLIMLFLVGCGSNEAPPATSIPETSATSTMEPPVATDPLGIGDMAPDFTLPDGNGNMVQLANQLQDNQLVVLVFYNSHL